MSNKMLIDATHPEETRVVFVRDKRVEDFDFEAASRKPLRGNIYLAKVIRVEPSLQAAFVDFGGNRHGFLPFSEIHPDYYQIPHADRQALIDAEYADGHEPEEPAQQQKPKRRKARGQRQAATDAETANDGNGSASAHEPAPAARAASHGDPAPQSDDDATGSEDAAVVTSPADDADDTPSAERPDVPQQTAAKSDPDNADTAPEIEAPRSPDAASGGPAESARADEPTPDDDDSEDDDTGDDSDGAQTSGEGGETPGGAPRRRRRTRRNAEGLDDPRISDAGSKPHDARERDDAGDDNGDDEGSGDDADGGSDERSTITSLRSSDALEEIPERRRAAPRRQYKIQEVIKRRQIILVQVVKEERGTKGAALTTYLSLAGRYSVLMPNTDRGGGVSRKITDAADRKRLKSIVAELDVPEGMGIILRTAGAARTKTEIKRDFEYLLRLWENVRELTLKSIAPQLVYEEGNLVKRSIRDLYSKEIDEILVAGEDAYREAKDFMRMLMPSHAKNVKPYREATPIFTAYQVEGQLDAMFSPAVTLPSKGHVVISPTEALVAIDVNSGKSTKESSIEDTALKTNLEAADEVARQLRLRDLAGLIVIDFIDMDEKRHNRQVEKRLKDALKLDRSRIQVGRVSAFGLMEMSRQRIRQGMVETSMIACPTCAGTGQVRSTQSVALHCLRALEEHLLNDADHHLTMKTSSAVALYILNQKRTHLNALEQRFGLEIGVDADENPGAQLLTIVKGAEVERAPGDAAPTTQISPDAVGYDDDDNNDDAETEVETAADSEMETDAGSDRSADAREDTEQSTNERGGKRRKRRKRRGSGGGDEPREAAGETAAPTALAETDETDEGANDNADAQSAAVDGVGAESHPGEATTSNETASEEADTGEAGETAEEGRNRRRRGRRGGRRHRRDDKADRTQGDDADESDGGVRNEDDSPRTPERIVHVPIEAQEGSREEAAATAGTTEGAAAPDETPLNGAAHAGADASGTPTEQSAPEAGQPEQVRNGDHTTGSPPQPDTAEVTASAQAESASPAVNEQPENGTAATASVQAREHETRAPQSGTANDQEADEPTPTDIEPSEARDADTHDTATQDARKAGKRRVGWWQRRSLF